MKMGQDGPGEWLFLAHCICITRLVKMGQNGPGEWLFPAMLPADFDLEPINLADQFVLSCLVSDILPRNAGGVPPVIGD
jgi:hypothetical protein